jgi:hypothetical protein
VTETITILVEEYERLLVDSKIIDALDRAGVDYWTVYHEVYGEDEE